ncbi:MAG TPA: iron ABC transporter permease, partial [Acidimicrobiaceae bacterium]|nr:iron ABC transporter permease [Acidimicrobiaceae bacterium]
MVPATVLAVFFLWPVGTLLARVLEPGSVADALGAPGLGRVLWFTFAQAVASTAITLALGCVPAYVLGRFRFPGRRALLAVVTVPFMLPTVVVGAAFLALLPESWHGTGRAVVVAHVFFNIAVVVRIVGSMWAAIPHDLTGAARTLGASPWQMVAHVVLPLLRPSLIAAGSVVFLFTFTSFGAAALLGGAANPTLEVEIARRATQLGDVSGAAVLSVLQMLLLVGVVWWSSRAQRRAALELRGQEPRRAPRSRQERRLVPIAAIVTLAVMAAPMLVMVVRSVRLGGRFTLSAWRQLGNPSPGRPGAGLGVDALASVATSLRYAAVATLIALAVGALASLAIAGARIHGRLLDLGMMLPLGTSAVTVGLGMLITFDVAPFDWRGEWWLVPVGHALVAVPFVVRAAVPVLRSIPSGQRDAAATLGASPLRGWWW